MNHSVDLPDKAMVFSARSIVLSGQVQSVGFRPFIYRLAHAYGLSGWVKNCPGEVEIHVQGAQDDIDRFVADIFDKKPPLADPVLVSNSSAQVREHEHFTIEESEDLGDANVSVPSDLYCCDDCIEEMNDPSNRRYRYPFINCTQCGPRYTLIRSLPYDRVNTTMQGFTLCPQCQQEYLDPLNRRFHAEPIACPDCGPSLRFRAGASEIADADNSDNESSLQNAAAALKAGMVLAVKGVGGYHLMCDATDAAMVARLRRNKPRPDKPLAVMFPSPVASPFSVMERYVCLDESDRQFLQQASRPLLLVKKKSGSELADNIAPNLTDIGVMLPYSPLHHLLLDAMQRPLVATSANISGDPVLIDNDAVDRHLMHVADACLHHDRPIERPADDPVFRTIAGSARPLRLGRGTSPLELSLPFTLDRVVLAVGAHMKNTVTLAWGNRAVISPHIGEMGNVRSLATFEKTIDDLQRLYRIDMEQIVCDAHPGYTTTRWAAKQDLPVYPAFHHHAHASSAYAESGFTDSAIVFTWDGVGYGEDGTLWGGETFIGQPGRWQRVASMRPFHLPGGDRAGRQPWRSAAALCAQTGQPWHCDVADNGLVEHAMKNRINTLETTSVGRLFDAAAALAGLRQTVSFEGQGPMELEALCDGDISGLAHEVLTLDEEDGVLRTDWSPLVAMLSDQELTLAQRANRFHQCMAGVILQQARAIRDRHGLHHVSFSGGVFQNRVLTELALAQLMDDGFDVFYPSLIPVNDAGISFGQIIEYGFRGLTE